MKNVLIALLVIIPLLFTISSCNKDSEVIKAPDIYGSWTVLQTDSQGQNYNVELRFNTDNSYDWILLDSVNGHSNSHAKFKLAENIMVITDDADCSFEGEYYIINEVNKLAIIAITDGCGPRALALEYIWKKK